MPDLATFQRAFADALMADGQPAPPFRTQAFAVYRNTSARGAVEALRAAYPTVDMLVGEEMFTQVALDYRREHPPAGPVLSDYGADFRGLSGEAALDLRTALLGRRRPARLAVAGSLPRPGRGRDAATVRRRNQDRACTPPPVSPGWQRRR